MFKPVFIYVFTLILFSAELLIAQGDFSSNSKCEVSISFLKDSCITCNKKNIDSKCKVEEFKYLGKVYNRYYYFAVTLEYDSELDYTHDGKFNIRNVIIFEGKKNKEKVKPVYSIGDYIGEFEEIFTELVSTNNGEFIHIYISNGNGHWDFGEYFIFRKGNWYKLDVPEVSKSLHSIIPKTYSFCKGGTIDLKKMKYDISVYKPSDPCAESTGGTARAYLRITNDNKIVITKTKYFPNLN